jgi:hypothetical protein
MILGNGERISQADLPGQQIDDGDFRSEDNLTKAVELYEKSHIQRTAGRQDACR